MQGADVNGQGLFKVFVRSRILGIFEIFRIVHNPQNLYNPENPASDNCAETDLERASVIGWRCNAGGSVWTDDVADGSRGE